MLRSFIEKLEQEELGIFQQLFDLAFQVLHFILEYEGMTPDVLYHAIQQILRHFDTPHSNRFEVILVAN